MGDKEKYIDNASEWVLKAEALLHKLLPAVITVLFGYVGVKVFTEIKHPVLSVIEPILIGYFIAELIVLFHLYECRREFLRDNWANMLLLVPFLSVLRVVGLNAKVLQSLPKGAKLLKKSTLIRKVGHGVVDFPKAKQVIKRMNIKTGKRMVKRTFGLD